jgi:hypothetical protein
VNVRGELTNKTRILSELFIGTLKPFIEMSSLGNLSVKFTKVDLDSTITNFNIPKDNKPEHLTPDYNCLSPFPGQIIYDNLVKNKSDTIIWVFDNNIRMVCNGGSDYPPAVSGIKNKALRGFVEWEARYMFLWDGCGLQLVYHEFFHSLQSIARNPHVNVHFGPSDTEKWKAFGWENMGKLETFSFQIRTFYSTQAKNNKTGWRFLSYADKYPLDLTTNSKMEL